MTRPTRRALGALFAVAVIVGALFVTRALLQRQRDAATDRALRLAPLALRAATSELQRVLQLTEGRVTAAVSLGPVRALVGQQVDGNTFRDSFQTEEWWRSFRDEFPVHQIHFAERTLDFSSGGGPGALDLQGLVAAALRKSPASRLLAADGKVYLASASVVDVPLASGVRPAVMALAKPFDNNALEKAVERSGGAVLLTDGRAVWVEAGPPDQRALLGEKVGQESNPVQSELRWAAAAGEVAPGTWLWTFTDTAGLAEQASSSMNAPMLALWGGALSLMVLALVLGFRRGRADAEAELAHTSHELEKTRAALERLSRQYVLPQEVRDMGGVPPGSAAGGSSSPGAPVAPANTSSGSTVGPTDASRYQIVEQLGEGGMAKVFLAVSHGAEGFRRFFVVKKLREELARQPDAVVQFVDEARLGASLVHSNIVPVFDFGRIGDEYFMAQEYILGRDLDVVGRRMKERERKRLDPALVFYIAQETLKALGYAHARTGQDGAPLGIVHRDVSPMNIMISARGEVKLFDFGIVKAEGRKSQTQHGVVKGNVLFMSPEQARGAYQIDGRADLFSLALTLYWCLSGETLYRGDTTYDLLMRAAKGPGPEEWERVQRLAGPAVQVLQRALQPAPGDRFQTADEFAAALPPIGLAGVAATLRSTMLRLFGEEFDREERRGDTSPSPQGPANGDKRASPSR